MKHFVKLLIISAALWNSVELTGLLEDKKVMLSKQERGHMRRNDTGFQPTRPISAPAPPYGIW